MNVKNRDYIYLDAASTVPMLPEVIKVIQNEMNNTWGNPSSKYELGLRAKQKIEDARHIIADSMNAYTDEIIFTGSASESNNLAIKGIVSKYNCCIVTNKLEHKSIIETCKYASKYFNIPIYYVDVDEYGKVNLKHFMKICSEIKKLGKIPFVSISVANSEIGTNQPITTLTRITHTHQGIFHTDATQWYTKYPIDVKKEGIDLLTVGGSKIGAGKGIGALYKKQGMILEPLIHGGPQENSLRAGTEDVPKICGFAKAVKCRKYQDLSKFRNYFLSKVTEQIQDFKLNGPVIDRLDNHLSLSFKNCNGNRLVSLLEMFGLYVSTGTACNEGILTPSAALKAICVPDDYINGTIRITMLPDITYEEIDKAVLLLSEALIIERELGEGDGQK